MNRAGTLRVHIVFQCCSLLRVLSNRAGYKQSTSRTKDDQCYDPFSRRKFSTNVDRMLGVLADKMVERGEIHAICFTHNANSITILRLKDARWLWTPYCVQRPTCSHCAIIFSPIHYSLSRHHSECRKFSVAVCTFRAPAQNRFSQSITIQAGAGALWSGLQRG